MISHLRGTLEHIDRNQVVVDVGNIGYRVSVPTSIIPSLPKAGEKIKLYTYQVVREDDISLYGFLTKEERNLFSLIITVNGVGPKAGLSLLSGFPLDRLVTAITGGDIDLITTVPGIGRKTAQKIVIELKEKIAKAYAIPPSKMIEGLPGESTTLSDALCALIALGYSPKEAREAIMRCGVSFSEKASIEEIIKQALKALG